MMAYLLSALQFTLLRVAPVCLCLSAPVWGADWPRIAIPPDVSAFSVGEQFTANGLPMRVQGFVTKNQSVAALAAWFRRSLGPPLVESRVGNKLILGRAEDGYYLSIQLEPLPPDGQGGSKGLLSVSDMAAFNRNRETDAASAQRWLERWPAGTQMLSRMTSQDNGRTSLHVVLRNGHSESLNRDALVAIMQEQGFALVQESAPSGSTPERAPASMHGAKALFFKGPGTEGIATIARDEQGATSVVLNTTSNLEPYRP